MFLGYIVLEAVLYLQLMAHAMFYYYYYYYYYYYLIKTSQFHNKAGNDTPKIVFLMRSAQYSQRKFLRTFGSTQ
jgi:hypothetical protein